MTFWRRLRPLYLISAGSFFLGCTGYIAGQKANASESAFDISSIFVTFGVGFLLAAVLEQFVFKDPHAA